MEMKALICAHSRMTFTLRAQLDAPSIPLLMSITTQLISVGCRERNDYPI
jgi:hypothetical protein